MKVLFIASEVAPIIKVGGIADVVSSLTREMKKQGVDIRIVIPYYKKLEKLNLSINQKNLKILKKFSKVKVKFGGDIQEIEVYQIYSESDIPIYLIKNDKYISQGGVYLNANHFSSLARFIFFSKAVLQLPEIINWIPDIIHCHDWQTGIIPLFLKLSKICPKKLKKIPVVFTIHNLLIQGRWGYQQVLKFLDLNKNDWITLKEKTPGVFGDDFNIMQQAILNADIITTVSPSYAKEIRTKAYFSRGLQKEIEKRKNDFYGILNGIDTNIYNPQTDHFIKYHYGINNLNKKLLNKLELQKKCGFSLSKTTPLLGLVSRLDVQKGIDLVYSATEQIIRQNCQLVFLGTGEEKYEKLLYQVAKKYPKNVASFIKFDVKLAQQIYAASDIFLMPSRFEPCGLCQMIAMHYGTIPIVRATGGLKDTVKNVQLKKGLFGRGKIIGDGFVFSGVDIDRFVRTIKRALNIYQNKKLWGKIQVNAMSHDFSWGKSVQKYLKLYKRLIK